jgi:hypothetical protein
MYNVTGKIINSPLVDGQVKKEMLTLSVPKTIFQSLESHIDEEMTLPIGFYVKNGQLVTFYPKHGQEKGGR